MERMRNRTLILTASALAASFAFAQDQPPPPDGEGSDVPGRAARLALVQGTVSFQPASVEDWTPATLNRPVTTGDRLWTEAGSRAELHLGSAAFRLNGRTNFSFINLDDRTAQVQLSIGSLSVRVRRLAGDETIEVDTPQAALTILQPGEYRVDVNEQGDTTIATVRGGEMEAASGQMYTIHAREQVRIMGGGDGAQTTFDTRPAPVSDGFDNWCQDRDRREDRSESVRYVSRDIPGYSDLDDNGSWRQEPDYGAVWYPRAVAVDWAPYRYGHWAWIYPWGWTWVDDAPWGYAPFHYGRWVFVRGAWGWVPGPVVVNVRPVYAPALVAWVGGPNFSIGVGVGPAVGWFPLGPREVFVPAYRYSPAYIERVNVTNTIIVNRAVIREVNVTNVTYVNRGVPGAFTAVSRETLVGGRPVAVAAVRVQPGMIREATVVTHAAVIPERGAVLGGREVVRVAPPAVVVNRTVVTRAAAPPPPVAFERQRVAMQSNPGRPPDRAAITQVRSSAPAPQQRPMYRQAPAVQAQPERQFNRPQENQPRQFDRSENMPAPQQRQNTPPPQQQREQPRQLDQRQNMPPQQPREQPRQFERNAPPQQQPQREPRSLERNNPPQNREQKQERREERGKERPNDRREREKEKSF